MNPHGIPWCLRCGSGGVRVVDTATEAVWAAPAVDVFRTVRAFRCPRCRWVGITEETTLLVDCPTRTVRRSGAPSIPVQPPDWRPPLARTPPPPPRRITVRLRKPGDRPP